MKVELCVLLRQDPDLLLVKLDFLIEQEGPGDLLHGPAQPDGCQFRIQVLSDKVIAFPLVHHGPDQGDVLTFVVLADLRESLADTRRYFERDPGEVAVPEHEGQDPFHALDVGLHDFLSGVEEELL